MTKNPVSLEKWRDYFSGADSDIFGIIEHAILVAASDFPYDFKAKRDQIAEMLFTCKETKCLGCLGTVNCLNQIGVEGGGSKGSRESKVGSTNRDEDDDRNEKNRVLDQDYDEAELLIGEIEEEAQILEEVLRIKKVVDDREEQSGEVLFESLRKLQLMPLSLEILKETHIGKSVNALRKQRSKQIRGLAKRLVEDWKLMVDAFYATTPIADVTPESAKTSYTLEEGGLPSPPLDEGAFFATPSMELSQIFDGMDDDGNLRTCGEFNKNQQNGRMRGPNDDSRMPPKEVKAVDNRRNKESTLKKESPQCKPEAFNAVKSQQNGTLQKKPEKLNRVDEAPDMRKKIEESKRKLQERYQAARNAKKMRTIKVVELNELPKQSRNQVTRPGGNHHRR